MGLEDCIAVCRLPQPGDTVEASTWAESLWIPVSDMDRRRVKASGSTELSRNAVSMVAGIPSSLYYPDSVVSWLGTGNNEFAACTFIVHDQPM